MWRLFSTWVILTQFYWLPGVQTGQLLVLKFLGFLIILGHAVKNSKNFKLTVALLLGAVATSLFSIDLASKLLLLWVIREMARSSMAEHAFQPPLWLVALFLLPSLGYILPQINDLYNPQQYFETHYRWLNIWQFGWNGVSTGYGYSLFFILTQTWEKPPSKVKSFFILWILTAVILTGSSLAFLFSGLFIVTRYVRLSLFLELFLLGTFLTILPKDVLLEAGNSRFEQYPELLKLDWGALLTSGTTEDQLLGLKLHNGYLSVIIEYGLLGVAMLIYISRNVLRNLSTRGVLHNVFFLFLCYNLFEPSNIFGNWSSLIPFWWNFFYQKNVRHSLDTRI
jgi:hypothetical protein